MRNRQFTLVSLIALACGGRVAAQTVEYAQALRVAPGRTDGGLLSQRAEIVVHGVPLPEALALLSEQARVPIAFSASLLPDRTHRVDCPCQAATCAWWSSKAASPSRRHGSARSSGPERWAGS